MKTDPIRLLVVVNVYRPDLGGGVLFADMCEGLAEKGFDITVKCAYSYYPEWKDKCGYNGWNIRSTEEGGVRIERHGLFIPSNPNSLFQRLIYEASFYASLRRRRPRKGEFDAVLVICPLVGAVAYAASVRRRTGAPLWLNVQDLSAQAAAAGGLTGAGIVPRVLLMVQNRLFRNADVMSSISESMVAVLADTTGTDKEVHLIPNWLHASMSMALEAAPEPDGREAAAPIRLLYSGNIGTKQDLLRFCRHLHESDHPFLFRIQGEGARAPELRTCIDTWNDDRFLLRGLSDEPGLAQALQEADFYVITERTGSGSSFVPSKLIPCIAAGVPVLAVCDRASPLGTEMETFRPGPRVDWKELHAVDRFFGDQAIDSQEYAEWTMNAKKRSEYYGREAGIERCADLIRNMIEAREHSSPTSG